MAARFDNRLRHLREAQDWEFGTDIGEFQS
jgi:hypothetical protein